MTISSRFYQWSRVSFLTLVIAAFPSCDIGIHPVWQPDPIPNPCVQDATVFGGGSGTVSDPYQICTRSHLEAIAGTYLTKYFIQMQDIDLGGSSSPWNPIPTSFTGTYDGNSKTITGLYYNTLGVASVGFFKTIGAGGVVKNLTLSGVYVNANGVRVGGLAGRVTTGTIQNCRVSGSVNGARICGGLAGGIDTGSTIIFSSSSANVISIGPNTAGGLVGSSGNSTIERSYANGTVTGGITVSGVGGLVGNSTNDSIQNAFATGSVTGMDVGGLVGTGNTLAITNSYATGAVTALAGSGGGLLGVDSGASSATNSYWDTVTSGQAVSAVGTGLTTAQMLDFTNYTGWDFASIWNGATYAGSYAVYPYLR